MLPVMSFVLLLAHQGGWDEMLMVVTPIGIFALLLRKANRRAEALAASTHEAPEASSHDAIEVTGGSAQAGDVGPE